MERVLAITVGDKDYEVFRIIWDETKGFTMYVQVPDDVVVGTGLSLSGACHQAKLSVLEYLRSKEDTRQIRRPVK